MVLHRVDEIARRKDDRELEAVVNAAVHQGHGAMRHCAEALMRQADELIHAPIDDADVGDFQRGMAWLNDRTRARARKVMELCAHLFPDDQEAAREFFQDCVRTIRNERRGAPVFIQRAN